VPRAIPLASVALIAWLIGTACSGAQQRPASPRRRAAPPPDAATLPHDSALFRIVSMEPGPAPMDSFGALESRRRVELIVADFPGALERTTATGQRLVYRPDHAWPSWQYSIHDIATDTAQRIGSGIAPRPLPFSDDFVYARPLQDAPLRTRNGEQLQYELLQRPFATTDSTVARPVGTVNASIRFDVAGAASPLRWMRVLEKDGTFILSADGIEPVPLPNPFGPGVSGS
jgi:hypothetical protein